MSYCYTGLAVRASVDDVQATIRTYADANRGTIRQTQATPGRSDVGYYCIGKHEDWTLVGFTSVCIIPALIVQLSRALSTKVITVGQFEVIGLQHYSEVDRGVTTRMFTYLEGEPELINVNVEEMFELARQSKRFRFPTRMYESDKVGYVHEVLVSLVSEINLEEIIIDELLNGPSDMYYQIALPDINSVTIGGRADLAGWTKLLAEAGVA